MKSSKKHLAVSQLCPSCGLCCNGVLFEDVELQPGDDPQGLAWIGLRLERKKKKLRFRQPCSCFDGAACRIYSDRPARCRSFACGLLKKVEAGLMRAQKALGMIASTKQQVEVVLELMRRLGEKDESMALSRRYAKLMAEPIDLSEGEELAQLRGELMLAMHSLMKRLEREFLNC